MPVNKAVGDPDFAGTVNGEGSLMVRVTKLAGDSTLARIIKLGGEAEEQKPPTQCWVDRFAAIHTPAVFVDRRGHRPAAAIRPEVAPGGYRALVLLVTESSPKEFRDFYNSDDSEQDDDQAQDKVGREPVRAEWRDESDAVI